MMPTLLVSGCSITHGAELHNGFMSPENIKKSFSSILAQRLQLNLTNVALSGGSNEYIFHSLVEEIEKENHIDSVIVVWTSVDRLYWKNNGRNWFFIPGWASSMIDLENFKMHDRNHNNIWYTGDSDEILDTLEKLHSFYILNYFDNKELTKKLKHYRSSLRALCDSKHIRLIDLSTSNFEHLGNWRKQGRHPTESEHAQIADFIYDNYYGNKK